MENLAFNNFNYRLPHLQSNSANLDKISKFVLVKVLSYVVDLTTDIKDGTLKMRGISQKWNEVVIKALDIKKNKDFFRNYHPLNPISETILIMRSELKDILHMTQIKLEVLAKDL